MLTLITELMKTFSRIVNCSGKLVFHLFGFGTIGGLVGVAGITIIEALFILLWSGQLSSIPVGLLANSYIYQLVLDNKTSRRYKALKLSQDSFLVSVSSH